MLTSVYIQRGSINPMYTSDYTPQLSSKDACIYAEWATFLQSVKGTLQHLRLEQGPRAFDLLEHPLPPGHRYIRKMDLRFLGTVWPVIAYERGDWPWLESLEILGVRGMNESDDVIQKLEKSLTRKFGAEFKLAISPDGAVMDHAGGMI